MSTLLVLDDDLIFCEALGTTLEEAGYRVLVAHTVARAKELLKKVSVDIVFIDVFLPDGNGLDLLNGLTLLPEPPEAIVITAQGDPKGAETAITSGAWDYVQKPANMEDILLMVRHALEARERKRKMPDFTGGSGIVGVTLPMRQALFQMFEAAQSDTPALIIGETGTGKELVARAIHTYSRRAGGPFVVVDCGAIAPTLLESELFGNVRGAFTGAVQSRPGLVALADGGTLFLDEAGELAREQQKVFLRLLQERSYRPIGSTEEVQSNFRIVAATNRNLSEMAAGGTFRSDLLFRLQGVIIELPPLRARGEDIELLVQHALARTLSRYGMQEKIFSAEAMVAFSSYAWPGNVRELMHAVEAAVLAASGSDLVLLQHLPLHLRAHAAKSRVGERAAAFEQQYPHEPALQPPLPAASAAAEGLEGEHLPPLSAPDTGKAAATGPPASPGSWKTFQDTVLYEEKRKYLLELLRYTGGNVPEAAREAGVSRQRLYMLLREHGIARQWQP